MSNEKIILKIKEFEKELSQYAEDTEEIFYYKDGYREALQDVLQMFIEKFKKAIFMSDEKIPITREEVLTSYKNPCILCNYFLVSLNDFGLKITFAEKPAPNEEPIFRNSIGLTKENAIQLHNLLGKLLIEPEKK